MNCARPSAAHNEGPIRIGASPPQPTEVSGRESTRLESERHLDLFCARRHRLRIAAPTFLPSRKSLVEWALKACPSRNSPARPPHVDSETKTHPSAPACLGLKSAACEWRFVDEKAKYRRRRHAYPSAAG